MRRIFYAVRKSGLIIIDRMSQYEESRAAWYTIAYARLDALKSAQICTPSPAQICTPAAHKSAHLPAQICSSSGTKARASLNKDEKIRKIRKTAAAEGTHQLRLFDPPAAAAAAAANVTSESRTEEKAKALAADAVPSPARPPHAWGDGQASPEEIEKAAALAVKDLGFSIEQAREVIVKYAGHRAIDQVSEGIRRARTEGTRNPRGWFLQFLKNGWSPQADALTAKSAWELRVERRESERCAAGPGAAEQKAQAREFCLELPADARKRFHSAAWRRLPEQWRPSIQQHAATPALEGWKIPKLLALALPGSRSLLIHE